MKKVVDVGKIKKGGYIIADNEACKVVDIAHSKAGKHGAGKYRMQVISVIGNKKKSVVMTSGSKVDVPIIDKHDAQILTIEERVQTIGNETIKKRIASVMDLESYETFEIEIPDDMKGDVKEGVKVLYWDVLGTKLMKQIIA